MPIYNSHISGPRLPCFRRIGYHIKSTKTNSSTSLLNIEDGEMIKPARSSSKRKFITKTNFDSSLSSKLSVKSMGSSAIDIKIESPPLVFYGPHKESTGAMLTGLMHIKNENGREWESFTMTLQAETLSRRPVHGGCADCATMVEVVNKWTFITSPIGFGKDILSYPFSYLLPGHLPATTNNTLMKISYALVASATSVDGDVLHFRKPITVERSILPGPDRHSVRVFPPTKVSATVNLPPVVHPGGDFVFDIRLDGIISKEKGTRWRLRKVNWRVDENTSAVSPACKLHSAKLGGEGKGVVHEDTRTVGFGEIKRGWKTDFDCLDGKVELEILAGIPLQNNAACNLQSPNGATVEHVLVVEMIVAEEHQPGSNKIVAPTGAARVLRMQFKLVVTGRSGLGISWDEEAPPVYNDVPASPPDYGVSNHSSTVFPPDYGLSNHSSTVFPPDYGVSNHNSTVSYANFPPVETVSYVRSVS